jgi:hypothetical protein
MKVDLPEGSAGPWSIRKFEVDQTGAELFNMRQIIHGMSHRMVKPGVYTKLVHTERGIVMSDTPAELQDHLQPLHEFMRPTTRRVLIAGLGLGCVLRGALTQAHIEQIDVVEIDPEVIALVQPHYVDPRLTIHQADIFTWKIPKDAYWDVVWLDVWDVISSDNLADMGRLGRRFARKCGWKGYWSRDDAKIAQRRGYH